MRGEEIGREELIAAAASRSCPPIPIFFPLTAELKSFPIFFFFPFLPPPAFHVNFRAKWPSPTYSTLPPPSPSNQPATCHSIFFQLPGPRKGRGPKNPLRRQQHKQLAHIQQHGLVTREVPKIHLLESAQQRSGGDGKLMMRKMGRRREEAAEHSLLTGQQTTMADLFEDCKRGQTQRIQSWITQKDNTKKKRSPLNIFRSNGSKFPSSSPHSPGWLCSLRQPNTLHTLLHLAALHGHAEMARLLLQRDGQLIRARDRQGCLPVHLAAWKGHLPVLEILLDADPQGSNAVDNAKQSALHLATANGHGQAVRLLLQRHFDPRLRNARQESPLDIAVRTDRANLCRLMLLHCPQLPLQCASDCCPSSPQSSKMPSPAFPLCVAARLGHEDCLLALLEHGFDVNYLDREGTALHVAVKYAQPRMAQLLLDHGIDAGIKDGEGQTALDWLQNRLAISKNGGGEPTTSKWRECRQMLEQCKQQGRNGTLEKSTAKSNGGNWKTLMPAGRENGHLQQVEKKVEPPIASPRSLVPMSTGNRQKVSDSPRETSPEAAQRLTSSAEAGPASACCTCVYQPLPDEATRQQANGHLPNNGGGVNYQNVPKGFYDNAPSTAAVAMAQRKWLHNCVTSSTVANGHPAAVPLMTNGHDHRREEWHQPSNTTTTTTVRLTLSRSPCRNGGGSSSTSPPLSPGGTKGSRQSSEDRHIVNDGFELLRFPTDTDGLMAMSSSPCSTLAKMNAMDTSSQDSTSPCRRMNGGSNAPLARPEAELTSACTTEPNSPERHMLPQQSKSPASMASSSTPSSSTPSKQRTPTTQGDPSGQEDEEDELQCLPVLSCNSIATLAAVSSSSSSAADSLAQISHFSPTPPAIAVVLPSPSSPPPQSVAAVTNLLFAPAKPSKPHFPSHKLFSRQPLAPLSPASSSAASAPPDKPQQSKAPLEQQPASSSAAQKEELEAKSAVRIRCQPPTMMMEEEGKKATIVNGGTIISHQVDDYDLRWKEIDDILNTIQRESFYSAQGKRVTNNRFPTGEGNGKEDDDALGLSNGHAETSSKKNNSKDALQRCSSPSVESIACWLRVEVGLEEWTKAMDIAQCLHANGFDQLRFMKGALNTKLMSELGIDRKSQLRICRNLNETSHAEQIPNAAYFEFVSDWLNALQLLDHLGCFSHANLALISDVLSANLSRGDLEKMGISRLGHCARIIRSLEQAKDKNSQRKLSHQQLGSKKQSPEQTSSRSSRENSVATTASTANSSRAASLSPQVDMSELRAKLTDSCVRFSAHYLGSSEISNVEGTEDCRRAMCMAKGKAGQLSEVPHVVLEISVTGVNILDANQKAICHQPISHIQVVCQDELDLNCFAYIFKDGNRHFSHVFCVLTAMIAKEIIVTLGEAFNLAYKFALQQEAR